MKLMIIGATGYVGSHLAEYFRSRGYELYLKRCELKEENGIKKAIIKAKPDYIINCAFEGVGSHNQYSKDYVMSNINIFLNFMEACKGMKLKKIIIIGSILEDNPISTYAVIKLTNSLLGNIIAPKYNLPLVTIKANRLYEAKEIERFCKEVDSII